MNAEGEKVVGEAWDCPEEVWRSPERGIISLSAGAHSSAAVCGEGNLYMWGKLLRRVSEVSYGW